MGWLVRAVKWFCPQQRPDEAVAAKDDPYKDQWSAFWEADRKMKAAAEAGDTEAAGAAYEEGEAIHQEIIASKYGLRRSSGKIGLIA